MWAPAVAACNAFVIVVNRKDWFGGLDQWGDRVTTAMEELSARLPIDRVHSDIAPASEVPKLVPVVIVASLGECPQIPHA